MATQPQTSQTQTQTKTQQPDPATQDPPPRARPNGHKADPAAQAGEQATQAAVETTDAMTALARQSQDNAQRWVRTWTGMAAQLNPLALAGAARGPGAGRPEGAPAGPEPLVFPARAWVEGGFEMLTTMLATERDYVDQVLAAQRRLIGQFLDAGAAVAAATRAEVARSTDARPARHQPARH